MGSSKPCPGCGKVHSKRKPTEVCRYCREKLDMYGELKNEFERATQDKITFKIGEYYYWNRYFSVRYPNYEGREIAGDLQKSIFNVCIAGSVFISPDGIFGKYPHIMSERRSRGPVLRASSQEFFDSIQVLMEVVQKAVDLSYEAGQKDGQKFLVDIAEGRKSIQDYEDRALKMAER